HGPSAYRHHVEHALQHLILVDAGGLGLEGQDDTVAQHVEEHRLDILRADEVATGQPGVGAGATVQGDTAARAGTVAEPGGQVGVELGREAGRHHQLHQVFLHGVGHV